MYLYFVQTNPCNPRHHGGLHTNTSKHVLTTSPSPGDKIDYALFLEADSAGWSDDPITKAFLRLDSQTENGRDEVRLQVTSHLGRSPMIGEDGTEDAFGNEILSTLVLEILNGSEWSYAPVCVEVVSKPEYGEALTAIREAWHKFHDERLSFIKDPETQKWKLDPSSDDETYLTRRKDRVKDALRSEFRKQVKALNPEEFEILKTNVLTLADYSQKEWINRNLAEDTKFNPVAMTIFDLTKGRVDWHWFADDVANFVSQEIQSFLAGEAIPCPLPVDSEMFEMSV